MFTDTGSKKSQHYPERGLHLVVTFIPRPMPKTVFRTYNK